MGDPAPHPAIIVGSDGSLTAVRAARRAGHARPVTGPGKFLLGSVPNKVSHHADRDLLIVKTD